MKQLILGLALAIPVMSGCAIHIMDADLVSMTHKEMPKAPLKKDKAVEEQWCVGDEPAKREPDEHYGLMDQVILKAQKKHKANYFADTTFYQKGSCMVMTGTVVK